MPSTDNIPLIHPSCRLFPLTPEMVRRLRDNHGPDLNDVRVIDEKQVA